MAVIPNLFFCLYRSFFPANLLLLKKIFQIEIIIPLWTVTGQVLLACLACLALSPGIAQICYQELGYTIANGNSVSMTV